MDTANNLFIWFSNNLLHPIALSIPILCVAYMLFTWKRHQPIRKFALIFFAIANTTAHMTSVEISPQIQQLSLAVSVLLLTFNC